METFRNRGQEYIRIFPILSEVFIHTASLSWALLWRRNEQVTTWHNTNEWTAQWPQQIWVAVLLLALWWFTSLSPFLLFRRVSGEFPWFLILGTVTSLPCSFLPSLKTMSSRIRLVQLKSIYGLAINLSIHKCILVSTCSCFYLEWQSCWK